MKTTAVMPADLAASVFAVPPLAWGADCVLEREQNRRILKHIEAGGISSILYGGNANIYNIETDQYAALLDMAEAEAAPRTWVIPSVGPDFGRLMAHAELLRHRAFPAAMLLPLAFASMPDGAMKAISRYLDRVGKPLILYIKDEHWLRIDQLVSLVRDGAVCGIKYAVPRDNPAVDPFLSELIQQIGTERLVCGLAEGAAQVHMRDFGLCSFTSGGVCMAPRLAMRLLRSLQANDQQAATSWREIFMPLERFRVRTQVFVALHEALEMSGIATMGAPLPMLAALPASERAPLQVIVTDLMQAEARVDH